MNIKLEKETTFILSDSCPLDILSQKFNEKNSETYKIMIEKSLYFSYDFKDATLSKDKVSLFLENNKKMKIDDFYFMLAYTLWDNNSKDMGGMLGLILSNRDDIPKRTDFLNQLKNNQIIDSFVFTLDYKDNYNGVLYIGNYFHDIDRSISKDDLIISRISISKNKWEMNIEAIISNNYIIKNITNLQLYYELGIIASPEYYHKYILENFFKNYLNNQVCEEKCSKEKNKLIGQYCYITCRKSDINIESFENLIFYSRDLNYNFTLNYKDLFYEFDNVIYFLIVFPEYQIEENWYIGKPFFLKYKLFLDKDRKTIGIYKNYNENIIDKMK